MSAERPIVSVIMANYNGARHLSAAIGSVKGQSLSSIELIVVDDGSSDDSQQLIARAAEVDRRVQLLVQNRNSGPAAARNRALDAARGRWIAVFDSDDLMAPDRLERLVERGEAEGADIVVDNLMVFADADQAAARPYLPLRPDDEPRWIGVCEYIAASRLYARRPGLGYLKPLIRAEALASLRYRESLRIGEDYDLVLRMLLKDARLLFDPRALYCYRKHVGSTSHVLRREHIEQMMAADESLAGELFRQGPAVRRMQHARTRAFQRALLYDRIIARLKARELVQGCALGLAHPGVWPLLAMPIEARLKRLRALKRGATATDPALA